MALEDTLLLNRQTQFLLLFPERIDPPEQRGIHADPGIVPRHLRGDFALHGLDEVVAMRACLVPEECRDTRQRVSRNLQRHDRIAETCLLVIAGNHLDLVVLLFEGHIEGIHELLVTDESEAWQALMSVPRSEERRLGNECFNTCRCWWYPYN